MKKIIFLSLLAIGMTGCSVESMDSEELLTADVKFKIQEVDKSMNLKAVEICAGESPVFVFNFPQDTKGKGDPKDTDIKIQIETSPGSGEWEPFEELTYAGAGPEEYTYADEILEVGTYSFRVSIGSGGFPYTTTLDVVECNDCEEIFSYGMNEDGSYTFTYIPAEDMEGAKLSMTFPQANVIAPAGWINNERGNSSAWKNEINLTACTSYSWTFNLTPDCLGVGQLNANLWTDFEVDEDSKKGELVNITQSCP